MDNSSQNSSIDPSMQNVGDSFTSSSMILQEVDNHLAGNILAMLFCCMPFSVIGIAYATQVNTALALGNKHLALHLSQKASYWMWLSFGLSLACWIIYGFFLLISVIGSSY